MIILAEDDALVRDIMTVMLQQAGYPLIACANGQAALTALNQEKARVRLLITDYDMPGMNGQELIQQVRAQGSALPVLVVSGVFTPDRLIELSQLGNVQTLPKPFQRATLLARVSALYSSS